MVNKGGVAPYLASEKTLGIAAIVLSPRERLPSRNRPMRAALPCSGRRAGARRARQLPPISRNQHQSCFWSGSGVGPEALALEGRGLSRGPGPIESGQSTFVTPCAIGAASNNSCSTRNPWSHPRRVGVAHALHLCNMLHAAGRQGIAPAALTYIAGASHMFLTCTACLRWSYTQLSLAGYCARTQPKHGSPNRTVL